MTKVDQFESAFKRAARTRYEHVHVPIDSILVLTDLDDEAARVFQVRVRAFLRVLAGADPAPRFKSVPGRVFKSVRDLLDLIASEAPDLVVTYRSLHSQAWQWTYTLGRFVDVLAQELPMPVLLLPNPHAEARAPQSFPGGPPDYEKAGTACVMALTDHLTGAHRLVSYAARFVPEGGKLVLAHVEDGHTFARTMDAIAKVSVIDTETARETLQAQLLKEPCDYIRSCAEGLAAAGHAVAVEEVVTMGRHLPEVKRLVEEHRVDLLVLNTKDEDQLAMHGLAYPLVVELRHVPTLMI